jgi:hypothetical protein
MLIRPATLRGDSEAAWPVNPMRAPFASVVDYALQAVLADGREISEPLTWFRDCAMRTQRKEKHGALSAEASGYTGQILMKISPSIRSCGV